MLILDGGTGRELARLGAPFRVPEWSALALIEGPAFVQQVHAGYLAAGADVVTTNSYAVVPFHIGAERFARQGERRAARAGALARRAVAQSARTGVRVAGSLPPVCGSYRPDLFDAEAARPVLETLVRGLRPYVDVWLAETMSTTDEADLVRAVIGEDPRPLWLSFTLRDAGAVPDRPALRSGESVDQAVRTALAVGAEALLFNCSQPEVMADALRLARSLLAATGWKLTLGVYANAFPPQPADADASGGLDPIRSDLDPSGYLDFAQRWASSGADIIGGCCGIGPEHITALARARDVRLLQSG